MKLTSHLQQLIANKVNAIPESYFAEKHGDTTGLYIRDYMADPANWLEVDPDSPIGDECRTIYPHALFVLKTRNCPKFTYDMREELNIDGFAPEEYSEDELAALSDNELDDVYDGVSASVTASIYWDETFCSLSLVDEAAREEMIKIDPEDIFILYATEEMAYGDVNHKWKDYQ